MMKLKKVVSMLTATAIIFSMTACGGAKTNETKGGEDNSSTANHKVAFILN